MAFDFKNKQFIGCLPVWAHKTHPPDQVGCEIWNCPKCKKPMWVSQRKRVHISLHQNVEIYCLTCIAEEANEQNYEIEVQEISRMN